MKPGTTQFTGDPRLGKMHRETANGGFHRPFRCRRHWELPNVRAENMRREAAHRNDAPLWRGFQLGGRRTGKCKKAVDIALEGMIEISRRAFVKRLEDRKAKRNQASPSF